MTKYSNPQPPEGINVSHNDPLITFLKLLAGFALIVGITVWVLGKSGGWIAGLVPFEQEIALSELYPEEETENDKHAQIQAYLEILTDDISATMNLPEGMKINVHYIDEDIENAFATLGGHIFLYKGLLKKLPNENSLAMLIAHEIAHVKLRHPIRAIGQQMAISTGVKLMLGDSKINILGNAGLLTQLHFSRSMETASDTEGLYAVKGHYGNIAGAFGLYDTLQAISSGGGDELAFFSTHPLDAERIQHLSDIAKKNNWEPDADNIQAFPDGYANWLK
ncbi:MAG: Unknown protein [uncultured Thiotrichaceae bacterium]|uniref:Peptidase M48 domain-containing protein n=2 Tax=uncultured Thiotrichaceae bacterium TaxID=298394 RepID=A0A6S6SM93_9GAMM|nr:MAG: Unknown protein [uncultured Thiotrichaceae bacterium]